MLKFLLILFFGNSILIAQTVSTVVPPNSGNYINNGLTIDSNGNVFASDYFGPNGTFNGSTVYKIESQDSVSVFANALSGPAGLAFDSQGNLFVANFNGGFISKVDSSGSKTTFATGLNFPAGLIFDSQGNLFIANYGNGVVTKITPGGTKSNFAVLGAVNQLVGITIDSSENLYVSTLNNGKIFQITSNGVTNLFATIPESPIGFLTFGNGNFFVTSTGTHKIFKVTLAGQVSAFAGSGTAGNLDGNLLTAQFTNPDGIAFSSFENALYISENNTNSLRKISNLPTTLNMENNLPQKFSLSQNYPNPFNPTTLINYELGITSKVVKGKLVIFNVLGEEMKEFVLTKSKGTVVWNGTDNFGKSVSSGNYFYQLTAPNFSKTKKMTFLK